MRTKREGLKLWRKFGDTPVNDDDNIDEDFKDFNGEIIFEKGTDKFEIWHWFEEEFEDFCCKDWMT